MSMYDELQIFTDTESINTWSTKPFIIASLTNPRYHNDSTDNFGSYTHALSSGSNIVSVAERTSVSISKYNNDGNRKIGYIKGVNDDGSFQLYIIGNGVIDRSQGEFLFTELSLTGNIPVMLHEAPEEWRIVANNLTYIYDSSGGYGDDSVIRGQAIVNNQEGIGLSELEASLYGPQWQPLSTSAFKGKSYSFLNRFGLYNGENITNSNNIIQLETSENGSLHIADEPFSLHTYSTIDNMFFRCGYADIGGSLNAVCINRKNALKLLHDTPVDINDNTPINYTFESQGSYGGHYCVFNIPLTRNWEEALEYIRTGEIPSDCFLYPFDAGNIPTNDGGDDPDPTPVDPDPSGDEPEETPDDNDDDTDPMQTDTPDESTLSLTNNNLYWLTSVELKDFITWFWTDATEIASVGDLWDKIIGLYENLAQAVLNVRYMPVELSWIGSASLDPSIVVGQIEKTGSVLAINKNPSPIRNIGTINFPTRFKGGFANYSPYATCSLFLPFHGFIDIDVDLLVGSSIAVRCAYDILSGTIQYFIYRGGYNGQLINTVVAKMAVDIPITLQTKNERDSAIFQNISSVTGNLIGAGASIVAGSPIGLTMAMSGFAGTQTQGAGLTVKGNVGENGAFYQPTRCALYVKRPKYNRPDCYASRVGYPANVSRKLRSCKGFTQVYNPTLNFSHQVKPYKSEIDEIYSYLEKGVIL